ncbi:hypothetical protein DBV15_05673 [Temnothorax longispinosus]|uniref:Uncharacterized protein n=1 Tax=Temnothorax longispinosus TaxID=300112 RepID=A0A4S2JRB0_9HYME|nr:hypothetical protein DBV15_05673 [Temnothorax longispinosus]
MVRALRTQSAMHSCRSNVCTRPIPTSVIGRGRVPNVDDERRRFRRSHLDGKAVGRALGTRSRYISGISVKFYDRDEDRHNLGILGASTSPIDQCGMQNRFAGHALDRSPIKLISSPFMRDNA